MNKKGFTLIELIIVIAIIALLAAATFVAVDPVKRIGDANDAQRWADVTAIADAIMMNTADDNGTFPTDVIALTADGDAAALSATESTCPDHAVSTLCDSWEGDATSYDLVDLITDGHLAAIPTDPKDGTANFSYYICKTSTSSIVVGACDDYGTTGIYVTR